MSIKPICSALCTGLVAVFALAGCDTVGNPLEALGAKVPPPDEFQVIASKPLRIPASTSLPTPTPGAKSPLEPDPHGDARAALLGTSGSQVVSAQPSAGELVLVGAATDAANSTQIQIPPGGAPSTAQGDEQYTPPTVLELLGLGSGDDPSDDPGRLDAQAESTRLLAKGTPTTVDPNAEPEEGSDGNLVGDSVISEYPPGRPQNAFEKDPTNITN